MSPYSSLILSLLLYQVILLIEGNLYLSKSCRSVFIGLLLFSRLVAASIEAIFIIWDYILPPVFAVIYRLVKEFVVAKENQVD